MVSLARSPRCGDGTNAVFVPAKHDTIEREWPGGKPDPSFRKSTSLVPNDASDHRPRRGGGDRAAYTGNAGGHGFAANFKG